MKSGIIKVEVGAISLGLRLITLTSTLIILDITKTKSNNVLLYNKRNKLKSSFRFFTDGKQHKARELNMITRIIIHSALELFF